MSHLPEDQLLLYCARTEHEVTTIRALINRMAKIWTGKTFLICPETKRELTFEELRQRVIELARRLLGLGLSKGEKVSFMLDNGLFTAELFLGAMYGGFVPVPLNVGAGRSQLEYTLNHSDTKVAFVSDEYSELLHRAIRQVGRQVKVIQAHLDNGPDWSETEAGDGTLPMIHDDDDALLVYTSGSTGQPKGVVVSHRNVLAGGLNTVYAHQLFPQDRSLCVLPLYHMNAEIVTLLPTLLSGGSVVMPHRFSVTSFWDWVTEYRCTWFALVPTIISQLLNWTDPYAEGKGAGLEQVRFARSSSAPLAPSQHRAFEEKFKLLLIEAMGSTEAGSAIFSNPLPPGERKIGSPGIPYGFDAKILNAEGRELPPGQTGEIVIRGPSVMKGYYKNPEATAEVISPDGWLYTGDLGYKDEDGYFFIIGRVKELIIKGGENIAPREIDETLGCHPAVMEAAAVGVPDRYLGEDIVAYVVLKPGKRCSELELLDFCESELGNFKTPTKIYFVEDLPKGPSGKVQRLRLVDWAEKTVTSEISGACGDARVEYKEGIESERGFVAPRMPVEQMVAEIWAELLKQEKIGVHDNFFELGGSSLLAIQILSRLRKRFSVDLSLHSLFEYPTVAQQAVIIDYLLLQNTADEQTLRFLAELEQLSDEEASSLLAEE